ncbi:hypothetical protein LTR50_005929 [Elasticomyces elasticus]|nr:hypothetical protein LTR50_005929 [Elasticomyces elasticus]
MAVPDSLTIKDISGTYTLNKALSDSMQPMLRMQNINFMVRQVVQYSSITVTLKQFADPKGKVHLEQQQTTTGGMRTTKDRIVDGEWSQKDNKIWGPVRTRTRFVKLRDIDDDFLKAGWTQDCLEGEVIETMDESLSDTWTARQVYGLAEVNGEKKQVRKIVAKKGDQVERIRMVYNWKV